MVENTIKTVAIIPIRTHSTRIKKKSFKLFAGIPLYQFFLQKLIDSPFDEIYVDTDSKEISDFVTQKGWAVIERLPELTSNSTNGNDLLLHHASLVDADIYFQLFITSPLLAAATIHKAHEIMTTQFEFDSLFTALKIFSWFWFDGKPVNYDPKSFPRSQDAIPIIRETTGLYAIRSEALKTIKTRIGSKPHMLFVNDAEATDIDREIDFKIAEFLLHQTTI